jgi:hypothetical protein
VSAAVNAQLLAACVEARVWMLGHAGAERQIALLDAAIAAATAEPTAAEPIPVGDAQDSDFGTFLDEVRK